MFQTLQYFDLSQSGDVNTLLRVRPYLLQGYHFFGTSENMPLEDLSVRASSDDLPSLVAVANRIYLALNPSQSALKRAFGYLFLPAFQTSTSPEVE